MAKPEPNELRAAYEDGVCDGENGGTSGAIDYPIGAEREAYERGYRLGSEVFENGEHDD